MSGGKSKRRKRGNAEREPNRTTVGGGGRPQREVIPRRIPRGVEVLIKKAAVDAAFKKLLLEKRAGAAEAIGLKLTAAEEAMLAAVPLPQLEGIIVHTKIKRGQGQVFLGYAAGAVAAAAGAVAVVYDGIHNETALESFNLESWNTESLTYRYLFGTDRDFPMTYGITKMVVEIAKRRAPEFAPSSVSGEGAADPLRSHEAIGDVVRQNLNGIRLAYDAALKEAPDLPSGKVTVKFTIAADGGVKYASVVDDTVGSITLSDSILKYITTSDFPPTAHGEVIVIYPLAFVNVGNDRE
jgi:hypothetical protein